MPDYRDRIAIGLVTRLQNNRPGGTPVWAGSGGPEDDPLSSVIWHYQLHWPTSGWHRRWARIDGVAKTGAGYEIVPPSVDSEGTTIAATVVQRPESYSVQVAMPHPMASLYSGATRVAGQTTGPGIVPETQMAIGGLPPERRRYIDPDAPSSTHLVRSDVGAGIDRWCLWNIQEWDDDGREVTLRGELWWRTTPTSWQKPNSAKTGWATGDPPWTTDELVLPPLQPAPVAPVLPPGGI